MQKLEFESNKKELEAILERVKRELGETQLDVIVQGAGFGTKKAEDSSPQQDQRTTENLKKIKNILDFQGAHLSGGAENGRSRSQKRLASSNSRTKSSRTQFTQTDLEGGSRSEAPSFRPTAPPSIQQYKPQELIRVE